ncbi:MAG: hypothetical protein IPP73_12260 [Chitinophagaceae bacterium]|nr:hypothetical protein [Chitinophagaceae bacterium]
MTRMTHIKRNEQHARSLPAVHADGSTTMRAVPGTDRSSSALPVHSGGLRLVNAYKNIFLIRPDLSQR